MHQPTSHLIDLRPLSAVPRRFQGLWQRTSIEVPTGIMKDVTTSVYWLQTPKLFADIRIPYRREQDEVSLEQVLAQRASAGYLVVTTDNPNSDGTCTWHCQV